MLGWPWEIDPNHNLSLILSQADNFENQLKEIDSEIQKFESRKKSLSNNHLEISDTVSKGECMGKDKGNLENLNVGSDMTCET